MKSFQAYAFRVLLWSMCFLALAVIVHAESPQIALVYPASKYEQLTPGGEDPLALYRTAIEKQGAGILVVGQGMSDKEIHEEADKMDGLLLPGGIDVNPARYGESPDPKLEHTDDALDALEYGMLEKARDRGIPVLGICRGHQIINVFYGGSLIQDIPSHAASIKVEHRGGSYRHEIEVMRNSLLHEMLDTDRMQVYTYHHQAVKAVAPGFTVTARAGDGIVEAMEKEGEVFIVGVQFHPEKLLDEIPAFGGIFKRFVQEAQAWHDKQGKYPPSP